jgi:hypothetical protein
MAVTVISFHISLLYNGVDVLMLNFLDQCIILNACA